MLTNDEIIQQLRLDWFVQQLALPSEVYNPPFVQYLTNGSDSILIERILDFEANHFPPERVNWLKEGF